MWRALSLVLALALAAALIPAMTHLREAAPPSPPVVRTSFAAPPGVDLGAADDVLDAAISPDGAQLAFVATREGRVQLWHRALAADRAEPFSETDGATLPAWKYGNRIVSFFSDGSLNELVVADGTVRRLASAPAPAGAAWQADGSLLFVPDQNGPVKLLRNGQVMDATRLASGDQGHLFPSVLDQGGFVYVAVRRDGTRVVRLAGRGDDIDLVQASGHAAVAGGMLVWARDGVLLGQRLDLETRALSGRAIALVPRVGVSPGGHGFFAIGPALLVAAPATSAARELVWYDASGQRGSALLEPGEYWQARLSPDDRRVALTALDPLLRTLDVFAAALDDPGRLARVSLSLGADSDPAWADDSSRVAYRSVQRGSAEVLTRAVGPSSAMEVPLTGAQPNAAVSDWRGDQILLQSPSAATGLDIWLLDARRGTRTQITQGGFNEGSATWSPDGTRIAYVSDESGQPEIYVARWPGGARRVRASFGGGTRPQWGRDNRTLFFMRNTRIMRTTNIARGSDVGFTTPEPVVDVPGLIDFSAAHRSDRFAVLARAAGTAAPIADVISGWTSLIPPPPPRRPR